MCKRSLYWCEKQVFVYIKLASISLKSEQSQFEVIQLKNFFYNILSESPLLFLLILLKLNSNDNIKPKNNHINCFINIKRSTTCYKAPLIENSNYDNSCFLCSNSLPIVSCEQECRGRPDCRAGDDRRGHLSRSICRMRRLCSEETCES